MADHVMPHEPAVRAWLARSRFDLEDIEDVIQEAYCRLASLDAVEHISRPGAYFFSVARNLAVRRLKRARVVPIDTVAEIESYRDDERPSPEQEADDRRNQTRLRALIEELPERCRRIVKMRKLEDRTQREIAAVMCMSEGMVEKELHKGVQTILRAWAEADTRSAEQMQRIAMAKGERG
ncbi:RNA polymerase sigma factor [Sphingosinicella rhizophila]|uniref:Sigma-70 family RNA polymerase sigma factor n=1 Tax=Sphingosinicella rhizophila TaxID=3050082 RepID=A0ABU3Q4J8_9SPHN|nr:sigma-70 family RNA polymerase sigma factor [Sphingosinicella sp. GR2756]MDT9598344.1 sigma-70 family RNA polymerase sigma factor [Sphingosinicella sp. GR2756]